jgi:hypothetical protein
LANDRSASALPYQTARPDITLALTRGIRRFLTSRGDATVTELRLASGRRADIVALDPKGIITIVEIKSGVEDLLADSKWSTYREYCDHFYFGVSPDFPLSLLPDDAGIIIGDAYDGHLLRESGRTALPGARRKSMMIRFAQTAAGRLLRHEDPSK